MTSDSLPLSDEPDLEESSFKPSESSEPLLELSLSELLSDTGSCALSLSKDPESSSSLSASLRLR